MLALSGVCPEYGGILRRHHERVHIRWRREPMHLRRPSFAGVVLYTLVGRVDWAPLTDQSSRGLYHFVRAATARGPAMRLAGELLKDRLLAAAN
jgi:hypothetical protein